MSRRGPLQSLITCGRPPVGEPDGFHAALVVIADLEQPPSLPGGRTSEGRRYAQAWVLARRNGRVLGLLTVDLSAGPVSAEQLHGLMVARWPDTAPPGLSESNAAISVVVPTCRRPDDVARCVAAVLATGYPRLQVLVVDNAPDDTRTAHRIADAFGADPRVVYLAEPIPGASRARNRGVAAANGDLVAFVDDDIVVDRHWLDALASAFEEYPDVSCVTGLVLPLAVDTPVQWWFEVYGGFDRGYERRSFDLEANRGDTRLYPYTAGALGGLGNAAFRRDTLAGDRPFQVALGPGTSAFGAEDQDVLLRILRAGRTVLYEPSAVVQHRHRETYPELRWQVFTYGAGFTAALTHWMTHESGVARELLARVPPLLPAAFGPGVAPKAEPGPQLPGGLRTLERLGYLYGPIAYLRATVQRRRRDRMA